MRLTGNTETKKLSAAGEKKMSGMVEFGFGSGDEVFTSDSKRFKMKDNEKYRLSFVWWPGTEELKPNLDASTPRFIGCKRFFIDGVGFVMDQTGADPAIQRLAGQPSKHQAATIICVWPVMSDGVNIDKGRFAAGDFRVAPWTFSLDKYKNIQQNHGNWPLGQHDINVHCTDAKYQKITIAPCRDNLFRNLIEKKPEMAQPILLAAKEVSSGIANELAQVMTIDQIRARLAQKGGQVAQRAVAPSGPPQMVGGNNMEIDDLLGGIPDTK